MSKRILLNLDLCCGCKSCSAACFYGHWQQSLLAHSPVDDAALLPMHCLHCEQPACAAACPNEAMKKDDDGIVRRSNFMCIGCKSCVYGCPFGVISENLDYHIVPKCDLCCDRLKEGEVPRCVASCTSGALSYEELDEAAMAEKKNLVSGRMLSNLLYRRR